MFISVHVFTRVIVCPRCDLSIGMEKQCSGEREMMCNIWFSSDGLFILHVFS